MTLFKSYHPFKQTLIGFNVGTTLSETKRKIHERQITNYQTINQEFKR